MLEAQGVSMCVHVCPQRSLADACGVAPLHSQFMELSGVCGGGGGSTGGAWSAWLLPDPTRCGALSCGL